LKYRKSKAMGSEDVVVTATGRGVICE
jgi:hypothetical protein